MKGSACRRSPHCDWRKARVVAALGFRRGRRPPLRRRSARAGARIAVPGDTRRTANGRRPHSLHLLHCNSMTASVPELSVSVK
ncbi:hypothetical protein SAMN04487939_12931 [Lysobacter sp. yr284]|uniref:hypothetical protein n=1 Tax=Lysobacter sp. yr284 TaxID=1761791 RepID=UPI00089770FC|nr:hypothetical protein [Lysobacter sp. yr284]SDZ27311.1 hypothetical protein SAMN04487939_12931 [Lysobacter sp. yr284]